LTLPRTACSEAKKAKKKVSLSDRKGGGKGKGEKNPLTSGESLLLLPGRREREKANASGCGRGDYAKFILCYPTKVRGRGGKKKAEGARVVLLPRRRGHPQLESIKTPFGVPSGNGEEPCTRQLKGTAFRRSCSSVRACSGVGGKKGRLGGNFIVGGWGDSNPAYGVGGDEVARTRGDNALGGGPIKPKGEHSDTVNRKESIYNTPMSNH